MVFLNFRFKKDFKYRSLFFKYEFIKSFLKFLMSNKYIVSSKLKLFFFILFYNLSHHSSLCFIKNRCLVSGSTRSVFRFFKLSRWEIKKLGVSCEILGLKKSSW